MPLPPRALARPCLASASRALARSDKRPPVPSQQSRAKRFGSGATKDDRKAAISRAIAENEEAKKVFGMGPIDYSVVPPVRRSPPPPPPRPGMQKFLTPAVILLSASIVGYFYVNNKNDNIDYWRAMQSGEALEIDDDEEDDDDELGEEDDEEEEVKNSTLKQTTQTTEESGEVIEPNQKGRGWFGWIRRWRRGDKDPSGS
ncbi:hypothetical protein ACHAWF_016459 [Thalassiosira exigua]